MKKTFLIFCGLSLILAASCSKTPLEKQVDGTCNPVELSFYASIGDNVDTRLTYTPDGNALKSSWNKTYDKLSLVSLDSYGNVVSSDIFTAQSSGKKVKFSGTYTNSKKASSIIIYYPAFSEGEGPYYSPSTGRYNKYSSHGPFGMDGSELILNEDVPVQQSSNGNLGLMGYFSLMTALINADDLLIYFKNDIAISLIHSTYIIKAELKMPEWKDQNGDPLGTYVTRVNMYASNPSVLTYSGKGYMCKNGSLWGGFGTPQQSISLALGNIRQSDGQPVGFNADAGETITVYMVGFRGLHEGSIPRLYIDDSSPFMIEVEHTSGEPLYAVSTKTAYYQLKPGFVYCLSATMKDPEIDGPYGGDDDIKIEANGLDINFINPYGSTEKPL
ncbi:MAG: hypothetical protein SPF15_01215 [Candidatus Cryptobacteroides sp.]|uniref:hypothetical protein n=1 Tax=Candidatus Cryptobacteroides sp. TaxID=2952915 RepID=UPI002A819343|nr:hypothetical protein [Candidatus Cryptobacteroides sp.]MDY5042612.1 hypothetical protein [Candidatus Cryptobacteroides sp.]